MKNAHRNTDLDTQLHAFLRLTPTDVAATNSRALARDDLDQGAEEVVQAGANLFSLCSLRAGSDSLVQSYNRGPNNCQCIF